MIIQSHCNILIIGNGDSFTQIDYQRLPEEYKVMRFNEFYKEDKYYAGKKVDYVLGYSKHLDETYFKLRIIHMNGEYEIDSIHGMYATVLFETNKHFPSVKLATPLIQENIAIAEFRCFYEYYYEQYLPTGMQGIALAATLGFDNIYLAGFDFFLNSDSSHPWDKEKLTLDQYSHIHSRHPQNIQIEFLKLLQQEFPKTKFLSVSEKSPINQYIEMAPVISQNTNYSIESKKEDRTIDITIPECVRNKERRFL